MTVVMAPSKPLRFREIEHMRALAVLVVIVHHLGGMPGGFIGVDIFFVISGFVITHALLESSHLDLLSGLGRFYYRRIIRILPPLLLVTRSEERRVGKECRSGGAGDECRKKHSNGHSVTSTDTRVCTEVSAS